MRPREQSGDVIEAAALAGLGGVADEEHELVGVMAGRFDLEERLVTDHRAACDQQLGEDRDWIAQSFTTLIVARVLMGAVFPMLALPEAIAADTMPAKRAQVTIGAIHAGTGIGVAGGLLLGSLAGAGDASWRTFCARSPRRSVSPPPWPSCRTPRRVQRQARWRGGGAVVGGADWPVAHVQRRPYLGVGVGLGARRGHRRSGSARCVVALGTAGR
jgi:hypothetical protein